MLFNTPLFIFAFLPIVFSIYFILQAYVKNLNLPKAWLVLSSLFFYGFWSVKYLPLLCSSIIFNYFIALKIAQAPLRTQRKMLLIIGLSANILLLGFFKYTDFFLHNLNRVFNSHIELLHLVLPLAISFFTLQQIAYLLDTYKQCNVASNERERERERVKTLPLY